MRRAEQEVPGIRLEQLRESMLPVADVVDLEPELDGQAAAPRLEHGVAVLVEVVNATLEVIGQLPDLSSLPEVVDVLGEADLVDAACGVAVSTNARPPRP